MRDELRELVEKRFKAKADAPAVWGGFLGNPQCAVAVPDRPNYVYVTMGDGTVVEAYNKVAPTILNLPVTVGFDPSQEKANLLEVLSVRNIPRYGASENAYHVDAHHASHEWMNYNGNTDVVYMQLRQFMPLRPTLVPHTASTPFQIYIQPAMQLIGNQWQQVGGSTISLLDYGTNPQTVISGSGAHAKYVLISMSAVTGSLVISSGSTKTIGTLALSDIPATPANHIPICAVRRYDLQPKILESRLTTDLVDLRWGMPLNGLILPSSVSPGAGFYLNGYNAASGSFSSGSIVLPLSASPGAGFYLTGYNAVSGSFSSGSVAANHNAMSGLQGGQANEYYHLTNAEHAIVIKASGSASDGYLTSADWNRFNAVSGSGVTQLSQLLDVAIGGQTDHQFLMWSSGSSKWIPGTAEGTGDVTGPAGASDGHVAVFDGVTGKIIKDGGEYVANPLQASGSTAENHIAVFTDSSGSRVKDSNMHISTTSPSDGMGLVYSSGSGLWQPDYLNGYDLLVNDNFDSLGNWTTLSGSVVVSGNVASKVNTGYALLKYNAQSFIGECIVSVKMRFLASGSSTNASILHYWDGNLGTTAGRNSVSARLEYGGSGSSWGSNIEKTAVVAYSSVTLANFQLNNWYLFEARFLGGFVVTYLDGVRINSACPYVGAAYPEFQPKYIGLRVGDANALQVDFKEFKIWTPKRLST